MIEEEKWQYEGSKEFEIPTWAIGYVYAIVHTVYIDGEREQIIYIGKKLLNSTRRKKIGVREKAATKTRKTYKTEVKNSGWENYWGSSKTLLAARETEEGTWTRHILHWCYSKKNMSWLETKTQIEWDVMSCKSYNDHIGNFYKIDMDIQAWLEYKEKMKTRPRKPRVKKQVV